MKKIFMIALFGLFVTGVAQAEDNYVLGGFEASGHIVTGTGYQNVLKTPTGSAVATNANGTFPGTIGAYINNTATVTPTRAKKDHDFIFFVDEVELDLSKTFGENVRFRSDLDFGANSLYSRSGLNGVFVEQAYATANIPVGNGIEFLVGRFNTPIGFEAVDSGDRDTISASSILLAGLRPANTTGLKFYYAFSDAFDLHFYLVNDLTHDNTGPALTGGVADSPQPSLGTRVGFGWGDEGSESTVGVSGAAGNENPSGTAGKKLTYLGDLDWNVYVTDAFAVGGEALYRLDGAATGGTTGKYMAGLLNLNYDFSDVWDGTLKYAYVTDSNGGGTSPTATGVAGASYTGANQKRHEIGLAANYSIADGATLKLEAGYGMSKVEATSAVANGNYSVYGVAGAFSYNF